MLKNTNGSSLITPIGALSTKIIQRLPGILHFLRKPHGNLHFRLQSHIPKYLTGLEEGRGSAFLPWQDVGARRSKLMV